MQASFLVQRRDERALPRFEERPPPYAAVRFEVACVHRRDEEPQVDTFFARERQELAKGLHRCGAARLTLPAAVGAPARKQLRGPRVEIPELGKAKHEPLALELFQR